MEIFKIPACWPTSFIHGISVTDMLSKENLIEGRYKQINYYKKIKIDNNLLDFIFQFCTVANLSKETSQAAIFIFEYFVNTCSDFQKYDIQLITMACILVCSKMFDVKPLSLSTLHRISAHIYNNAMILHAEKIILTFVEFDLFLRDRLIIDRVGLYLESVRFLLDEKDFDKFRDLCFKLTELIYEDISIIKDSDFNLLCASIIQAALVISIKREGKLPLTIKLSIISGIKEEEMMKLSKKIIKHCLDIKMKQIYSRKG